MALIGPNHVVWQSSWCTCGTASYQNNDHSFLRDRYSRTLGHCEQTRSTASHWACLGRRYTRVALWRGAHPVCQQPNRSSALTPQQLQILNLESNRARFTCAALPTSYHSTAYCRRPQTTAIWPRQQQRSRDFCAQHRATVSEPRSGVICNHSGSRAIPASRQRYDRTILDPELC